MDERKIDWRGSSYKDLRAMPERVRRTFGYALGLAQNNLCYEDAKTLAQFRPTVVEILEDDDGDTYRAIYTAHFQEVIYVLHCFKKKSTSGRNLPKRDKERIDARLADVKRIESEKMKSKGKGS